jgi:hypothetical protein
MEIAIGSLPSREKLVAARGRGNPALPSALKGPGIAL